MTYVYPATDLDRPRNLLAVLGSFWTDLYRGSDQIDSIARANAQMTQQTMLDLLEVMDSLARNTVPIYHRDNWYALTIKQSERNDSQTSLLRYDGTANYDAGHSYDVSVNRTDSAFPLPADLRSAPLVMNRFINPSVMLTDGTDYEIDLKNNAIVFRKNPFDNPRIATRDVIEDATAVDKEAILWIFRGEFDWETIYKQYGYVLGLRLASSEGYRSLMDVVFDALVQGTTRRHIERAFAALSGVPLVVEPTEVVEVVTLEANGLLIVTDLNVYTFNTYNCVALVAEGDTVRAGDPLVDALQFYEFNRGITPAELTALAVGKGFLTACYYGDLIFENKEYPLTVITNHVSGFTKVTFPLGGFPLDVTAFFDELHERGILEAAEPGDPCIEDKLIVDEGHVCYDTKDTYRRRGTLAHLLDTRENRIGEPTEVNLPTTINPLKFLIENVLRNNAYAVKIKAPKADLFSVGLYNSRLLSRITPPHTAMFLIVELTQDTDSVTVDMIDDTNIANLPAMEPLEDNVQVTDVNDSLIVVRTVSGTCQ